MIKNITNTLKIVVLGVVLSLGLSVAYAWTDPTTSPPDGNVAAPVNVSSVTQTKAGGFNILGSIGVGTEIPVGALDIYAGEVFYEKSGPTCDSPKDTAAVTYTNAATTCTGTPASRGGSGPGGTTCPGYSCTTVFSEKTNSSKETCTYWNAAVVGSGANGACRHSGAPRTCIGVQTSKVKCQTPKVNALNVGSLRGDLTLSSNAIATDLYVRKAGKWVSLFNTQPLATVDATGAWAWTRVVTNQIHVDVPTDIDTGWVSVAVDTTKPILGLQLSGDSDQHGFCVAGFPNYFFAATARNVNFDTLNVDGSYTTSQNGDSFGGLPQGTWIFDSIVSGRNLNSGGVLATSYNKAAGLTSIFSGKATLMYRQVTHNGKGPGNANCYVDVLYGVNR